MWILWGRDRHHHALTAHGKARKRGWWSGTLRRGLPRAARGVAGGVTRGAAVVAAQGRNPGGTAGSGRGATGGSKPGGVSGAGRRGVGVELPAVVRWVPMVETVEPDSQRKSRPVRLGEVVSGKLSSSKTICHEMIRRFFKRSRQR
jgi:hypothetical protein